MLGYRHTLGRFGLALLAACGAAMAAGAAGAAPVVVADPSAEVSPLYVGPSVPAAVPGGTIFDGVSRLVINLAAGGAVGCSGSLLNTTGGNSYVLTAAHCMDGHNTASPGTANFDSLSPQAVGIANAVVHPGWTGDVTKGNDLALLLLNSAPSVGGYNLYGGTMDLGGVGTKVGYGYGGAGATGNDSANFPFGTKRAGENLYDAIILFWDPNVFPGADTLLLYDFDDGTPARDASGALGQSAGLGSLLEDLGRGANEVMAAPGDSGGPTFISGAVAGVTSFRFRSATLGTDIDGVLNSSFGEFGVDMRVSDYISWIASVVASGPGCGFQECGVLVTLDPIPEPGGLALAGLGLAALLLARRRRAP